VEAAVTSKAEVIELARRPSEGNLQQIVVQGAAQNAQEWDDSDVDLPWHAVATPEDVLEDLLTTTEGLTSGARTLLRTRRPLAPHSRSLAAPPDPQRPPPTDPCTTNLDAPPCSRGGAAAGGLWTQPAAPATQGGAGVTGSPRQTQHPRNSPLRIPT
jgi:hypothetical protein